jgi:DNA polymerase III epsilon subunit family exonuclease
MLLKEATFTVFDFETTGLYPYGGDKICEIGAIKIDLATKIKKKFHSLVDPQKAISRSAFLVNGITYDMLREAPKIYDVLPSFLEFIKGSILVAYNAGFDVGFFECALKDDKYILEDYYIIDVLRLARILFPEVGRYNLANVARTLGMYPLREHRAISDASMTLEIFKKELDILTAYGVKTIDDIAQTKPKRARVIKRVKDYKIELIKSAIRNQKKLSITYLSCWKNELSKRIITPEKIQQGYDRSYLVAHCHLKGKKRNFRLDGIVDVRVAERRK